MDVSAAIVRRVEIPGDMSFLSVEAVVSGHCYAFHQTTDNLQSTAAASIAYSTWERFELQQQQLATSPGHQDTFG